jgi:GTP-dependent phosphoenolpyruvate carboxykinase
MPTKESFDLNGLNINQETFAELFKLDKQFLLDEVDEIKNYLDENVNDSAPNEIYKQLNDYKTRILNEM